GIAAICLRNAQTQQAQLGAGLELPFREALVAIMPLVMRCQLALSEFAHAAAKQLMFLGECEVHRPLARPIARRAARVQRVCLCYTAAVAKVRTVFACQACGYQSPRWLGRCPNCEAWNSLVEEREPGAPEATRYAVRHRDGEAQPITAVPGTTDARTQSGITE